MLPFQDLLRKVLEADVEVFIGSTLTGCTRTASPALSLSTSQTFALPSHVEVFNRHTISIHKIFRLAFREHALSATWWWFA